MLHVFTTDDASNYEVSIGVSDPFGNYYGTFGENAVFPLDFEAGQCDVDGAQIHQPQISMHR